MGTQEATAWCKPGKRTQEETRREGRRGSSGTVWNSTQSRKEGPSEAAKRSAAPEIVLLNEFDKVSKDSLKYIASKTGTLKSSDGMMSGDKEVPGEVFDCSWQWMRASPAQLPPTGPRWWQTLNTEMTGSGLSSPILLYHFLAAHVTLGLISLIYQVWLRITLIECKLVQLLWKTVWRFLKKLKIELLYDPAIPLLGIYLEKMKTLIQKATCTPMFIAALFTIARTWKQSKCPSTDYWLKKMWHIYIMKYYSAINKNEILPFATRWMNLEIILSEVSQI